jgi:hypothetical protein
MAFTDATRRKIVKLPDLVRPTGGGSVSINLPKTGLLSKVLLRINATAAGTLSVLNPLGLASIISRVRLSINSGIDLVNISGPGYFYLLSEMLESEYFNAVTQTNGRDAVVNTANRNLDIVLPIAINNRDPIGLVMLQNEQTLLTLTIEFLADASVATGATVTATVTPFLELFTVPFSPKDYPPLNVLHQILEESQVVAGAGEVTYNIPRGNTYLQLAHGVGMAQSGADSWTTFRQRINQSEFILDWTPGYCDMEHRYLRGRARSLGTIFVDMLATSGLGNYGLSRDLFDSAEVTDFAHVIQATGATTLYTVRRQLVKLN